MVEQVSERVLQHGGRAFRMEQEKSRAALDARWKAINRMGHGDSNLSWYAQSGAAKVRILQDGTASVVSATQDMGGGTYTTMVQVASDALGIPVERIHSTLG